MGNSFCTCPCFLFSRPPPHLYEIHVKHNGVLTLHDGLGSLFVKGEFDEVVFDKKVLLVIAGAKHHSCYQAWIPEAPVPFEDCYERVTMVAAVLKAVTGETDVIVVYDSAQIVCCIC